MVPRINKLSSCIVGSLCLTLGFCKIPVPFVGKHVVVQGLLTGIEDDSCTIVVKDITLGPSDSIVMGLSRELKPPSTLKHFEWGDGASGKKKGKCARKEKSPKSPVEEIVSASSSHTAK
ncbi:hypothetical protein J3R83DRAFT_1568 [Lanmaoa asiatica]|nr:hypothetical protein J3R83DRAFT_1568 [Lanmaoa asiatica]